MKNEYIKYENLSSEIKTEIDKYYKLMLKKHDDISLEDSMIEWFNNNFDKWLNNKFLKVDSSNKRKYFRLYIEIPIFIVETLIESSQNDPEAKKFAGNLVNVSKGGIYFKYNNKIEISSIIKLIIDLSDISKALENIEALATVVRIDELDDNEYGIGVIFNSLHNSNQENLDLFILKNLVNHIYPVK